MAGGSIGKVGRHVAANVRRLRKAQSLSVQALADRVEAAGGSVDRPVIFKIETMKRRVTVDDLVELAAALGVQPIDLLAAAPDCRTCQGSPPPGFQCRTCGTESDTPEPL